MMGTDKILIGADRSAPLYSFSTENPKEVKRLSCVLSSALSGDELAIDQLLPTVYSEVILRVPFVPSGSSGLITSDGMQFMVYPDDVPLEQLPYGTPVWYYSNSTLMGKFYLKRALRSGKFWVDITAVSAIGILDGQTHYGGIYTGQKFRDVAADIIGGAVSFSCGSDVGDIQIYGWLPVDTRRNNLHQLLFSCGVAVAKDADGNMVFGFPDTSTTKSIPDGRIFLNGSVDHMTPATRVEVTEHAFMRLPSDETVILYDNTDGTGAADHTLIIFQEAPVYDLQVSGSLRIIESGVNYAVVSGTGVLTGRKYTHTTKVISKETGASGEQKTVSPRNDITLINVANSSNVAKRVLSYYASARTISADIKVDGEKPGDQISFSNPFGEPETAFLASMDINASSFLRAACELVTGYTPVGQGNNYTHVAVLTGSGTWSIPQEARKKCRAVLLGGGNGGEAGLKGEDSCGDLNNNVDPPGKGGEPGAPGLGGKILSVEIDLTGMSSIAYSCGAGGKRGIHGDTPTQAEEGGDTTFGQYTSANGERSASGCANLFSGDIYGLTGKEGIPGGSGRHNNQTTDEANITLEYQGTIYTSGVNGQTVIEEDPVRCGGIGGGGGGPAAGNDGGPGGNGNASYNNGNGYGDGGNGGKGANAVPPPDVSQYGNGGNGGNGGGGGGQPGEGIHSKASYRSEGADGLGGEGSDGSDGAPGCIALYY